jgi:hypothetical protein
MTVSEKLKKTRIDLEELCASFNQLHLKLYDSPHMEPFIYGAAHGLASLLENMVANAKSHSMMEEEF